MTASTRGNQSRKGRQSGTTETGWRSLDQLINDYAKKSLPEHTLLSIPGKDTNRGKATLLGKIRLALEEKVDPASLVDLWAFVLSNAIRNLKFYDTREFQTPPNRDIDQLPFGIDRLRDYFGQFIKFERLLYGTERYYRDHVKHVFKVWLLGCALLEEFFLDHSGTSYSMTLDVVEPQKHVPFNHSRHELDAAWCVASLCHDLGYPLAKVAALNAAVRDMLKYYGSVQLGDFSFHFSGHNRFIDDSVLRIISSRVRSHEESEGKVPPADPGEALAASRYATSLQTKYYLKLSKSLEDLAHGIISAFVVFKNLVYFLETDYVLENEYKLGFEDARQFTIRREILRAVAGHTCPEIYHFQSGTLPFFLLLVDEMQFWGRPTFDKMFDNFSPPDVLLGPDFTRNCWQFMIRLPVSKIGGGNQLFLSKASMFKKVLRTGADFHRRDFTLDLRI